jgi:DNA-binding NtrC family response regulator
MNEAEIVGTSAAMQELTRSIRKAARGNWTVLIQGESGTGKGLAARAIHDLGARAGRPFVLVNCGGLPENLIESELFGHERGAFTGADRRKKGKFELAHGGTIFLDEIGELSLAGQTRLLHVLQDKQIERLGGEGQRIPVDVRIIAATNRDLDQLVAEGAFRQDLFFRLNVFALRTPSLRERAEDIPSLAQHFALKCAGEAGRSISRVSSAALEIMQKHTWPGNIRQLENVIHRAVAVGETEQVLPQDLPSEILAATSFKAVPKARRFYEALDETAREVCIQAFTASKGNCVAAAQLLGLHRNSIYRLVRRYGLRDLMVDKPGPRFT